MPFLGFEVSCFYLLRCPKKQIQLLGLLGTSDFVHVFGGQRGLSKRECLFLRCCGRLLFVISAVLVVLLEPLPCC